MARLPRLNLPGIPQHIVQRGNNRQVSFFAEHDYAVYLDKLKEYAKKYKVAVHAYVLSNHVHVVVHVDKDEALSLDIDEVLRRYHQLHNGTLWTQKYVRGDESSPGEGITVDETVEAYRQRLYDISWLMRDLNENIALEANKEDNCTGRFWEGRFKSQACFYGKEG